MSSSLKLIFLSLFLTCVLDGCQEEPQRSNETEATTDDLTGNELVNDQLRTDDAGVDTNIVEGAQEGGDTGDQTSSICTPDPTQWDELSPLFERHCGRCHGETPQYGAPISLHTLSDFSPARVEVISQELALGLMPPVGQPMLSTEDRFSMISWLRCGQVTEGELLEPGGGFDSTRPILQEPDEPLEGVDFFEVRATAFEVPSHRDNRYECFTIQAPTTKDRFIKRIETIVDDARVLHHIVLIPESGGRAPNTHGRCLEDNPFKLIYGWAPGQGALQFPEGGIRLKAGQSLTLQIHYNNRGRYTDAIDSSGVRIYHAPAQGPEVSVLTMGPVEFEVPPRSRGEAVGYCELPQDTKLFASFPHMHEAGVFFSQELIHNYLSDEETYSEDLITLNGWDFESQYVYDTPFDLKRGDLVKTTCIYENTTDEPIIFGPNTEDEMCFNFAYVTPPLSISLCNQKELPLKSYIPGECAPPEAESWTPPSLEVAFSSSSRLPQMSEGPLSEGLYWIDDANIFIEEELVIDYDINVMESGARGRGAVVWGATDENGETPLMIDLISEITLVGFGLSFTRQVPISYSGVVNTRVTDSDLNNSPPLHFEITCGELEDVNLWINSIEEGGGAWITIPLTFGPIVFLLDLHLSPASL